MESANVCGAEAVELGGVDPLTGRESWGLLVGPFLYLEIVLRHFSNGIQMAFLSFSLSDCLCLVRFLCV